MPKNPEVKRRSSYRGQFEDSWWSAWPKRGLPEGPKSPIDFAELVKRAEAAGVRDLHTVKHVAHQLEHGAPWALARRGGSLMRGPTTSPVTITATCGATPFAVTSSAASCVDPS